MDSVEGYPKSGSRDFVLLDSTGHFLSTTCIAHAYPRMVAPSHHCVMLIRCAPTPSSRLPAAYSTGPTSTCSPSVLIERAHPH